VTTHDLTGPLYKQEQDVELARRQLYLGARTFDAAGDGIDEEIARALRDREPRIAAPMQRSQPSQQLIELERLREVVIRARVEPVDAVAQLAPRGEEKDRNPVSIGAQLRYHARPIEHREHPVE